MVKCDKCLKIVKKTYKLLEHPFSTRYCVECLVGTVKELNNKRSKQEQEIDRYLKIIDRLLE